MKERGTEILCKRVSFEAGVISLLSVVLFFVFQIFCIEAYDGGASMQLDMGLYTQSLLLPSSALLSIAGP